jgi:hypothetical protein
LPSQTGKWLSRGVSCAAGESPTKVHERIIAAVRIKAVAFLKCLPNFKTAFQILQILVYLN